MPAIYYDRLIELASKQLSGIQFAGLPLKSRNGRYQMDARYPDDALDTLLRYVERRPDCLADGLGIVLVRGPNQAPREFDKLSEAFWPCALSAIAAVESPISERGEGLKRAANIHAEAAIRTAAKLSVKLRRVTTLLASEVRRTPWLLPLRNFNSPAFSQMLKEISSSLVETNDFESCVREAHNRFVAKHSVRQDGKGWVFTDNANVEFKTPPRNRFHGARPDASEGGNHTVRCFFTARLRIGGYYPDGFHYDCRKGSKLSGDLRNCHDETKFYKGNPHLNIFPNDYIR